VRLFLCGDARASPPFSPPLDAFSSASLTLLPAVVTHHFEHVSAASSSAISALFLRILLPLKHLARSPAADVPLPAFLRSATDSILSEGTRIRLAAASLEKLAVAKVLERASFEKRPVLHVLAAGNDPLVAGVLRELVHYVTTISAHPCVRFLSLSRCIVAERG
jgi:hypothetical protein